MSSPCYMSETQKNGSHSVVFIDGWCVAVGCQFFKDFFKKLQTLLATYRFFFFFFANGVVCLVVGSP